jgi:hypothetical protein
MPLKSHQSIWSRSVAWSMQLFEDTKRDIRRFGVAT